MNDADQSTHILVVDDTFYNLEILSDFLEQTGFLVTIAESGVMALAQVQRLIPDLILLDIVMPDLDGFEVCRRLKASHTAQDIPVIFMTALDNTENIVKGFDLGAVDYIVKPLQLKEVLARLETHLAIQHLRKNLELQNERLREQNLRQQRVQELLKESRERYRLLADNSTDIISTQTPDGIYRYVSPACESLLGYKIEEMIGHAATEFIHPQDLEIFEETRARLSDHQSVSPAVYRTRCLDGTYIWLETTNRLISDPGTGRAIEIVSVSRNVTERVQAEEALRRSEERYALVALSASDGLWDWNLETNRIYYSSRWMAMLGYGDDMIGDSPTEWFSRVHPEDWEYFQMDLIACLEGRSSTFRNEHRILHRDGTYRWVVSQGRAARDKSKRAYRMAGSQTDITQRKLTEAQLMYRAFHDTLTGLPNRTLFRERLERAIEQMAEDRFFQFAVLFLDLDRFKIINDSLGHTIGDKLLVAIARRLKTHLRAQDMIARLGGDEFAILLNGIQDADEAIGIADRIQAEMSKPFSLAEHRLLTTTSIGIALGSINYEWPEDILRDADMAMYQAKARGRARHEIFKIDLRTQLEERWQMESDLRYAIERAQFQLYYQPILSVANDRIVAVEALLRWEHPQHGLIDPEVFIPLAEEIGMISSVGAWVLQTACTQMVEWHATGNESLRLSVNVSPFQLQQPPAADPSSARPITALLPELVRTVLAETSLPPQSLELEITESMAMLNQEFSLAILQALSEMGVQIAVDDFGLGSALDFLRCFPIDTLKIDQYFVKEMTGASNDQAFITAIIAMAHSLGLKVVAEGVETEAQLELLQNQDCDEWQGFLFSPPLSSVDLTTLLQSG